MRTIKVFDAMDYDPSSPRHVRMAARAIIIRNGKIALLHSEKYGIYVFPGGKIEPGETAEDALVREVREEAGLVVIHSSIRPYGEITVIRKDFKEEGIFEQHSCFFACDVGEERLPQSLTKGEAASGYRLVFVSLEQAVAINEGQAPNVPWYSENELYLLKRLRDETAGK